MNLKTKVKAACDWKQILWYALPIMSEKNKQIIENCVELILKEEREKIKNDLWNMKTGWHYLYCCLCGKQYSRVEHFGGRKKLKKCKACQNKMSVCFKCYQALRKETIKEIEKLIVDEILICQKEGTPTSRLTSLSMKISKL